MWSFFCHCVIEALAGFFSSVLSKGSMIVKCCKGLGREKELGGVFQRVEEFLYEGGGQVDRNKKNVFR